MISGSTRRDSETLETGRLRKHLKISDFRAKSWSCIEMPLTQSWKVGWKRSRCLSKGLWLLYQAASNESLGVQQRVYTYFLNFSWSVAMTQLAIALHCLLTPTRLFSLIFTIFLGPYLNPGHPKASINEEKVSLFYEFCFSLGNGHSLSASFDKKNATKRHILH